MPAATAFSIKASEMAELDPRAIKSFVNGTPNFPAISLTFSILALASAVADAAVAAEVWATLSTTAGAAAFTVNYKGFFGTTAGFGLWEAMTWSIMA